MAQRRGTEAKLTVKQQRAIAGFIAVIHGKDNKSLVQVLLDAGYAPETARQWTTIMASLRPHLQPTLDWMELHRARIMRQMDEKVGSADYTALTRALDVLTKNHQLLGGKPTHNFNLSGDKREELEALLDD